MSTFKDRLEDLVVEVPAHLVRPDLAAVARRAGARRRRNRRRALVAAGVVTLGLAAGLAAVVPHSLPAAPADLSRTGPVGGYPARIDYPYLRRELTSRPGPIAGLLVTQLGSSDGGSSPWWAVTERGGLLRLPSHDVESQPSLSATGARLMMMDSGTAPPWRAHPVLWDLVTGRRVTLSEIGTGTSGPGYADRSRSFLGPQSPSFWSPDESRILLSAYPRRGRADAMVADWSGSLSVVTLALPGRTWPVGWAGPDRLGWLRQRPSGGGAVDFVVTDLSGRVSRSLPLEVSAEQWSGDWLDQWSGSLSPDGRRLAVRYLDDLGSGGDLVAFDAATGRLTSRWRAAGTRDVGCPIAWQDDRVALSASSLSADGVLWAPTGTAAADTRVLIRADPRIGAGCSVWAPLALAGGPHRGPVERLAGGADWPVLWWWRETLAALALIAGVAGWLWWRRSRRISRPRAAG